MTQFFGFLFFFIFSVLSPCQGGVFKSMQSFFNKFGAVGNATEGSAFQDQSAGYMTGGSLFIRNPVRTQRMSALTVPGYRMGCGGIDVWAGGLSYINKDQLKQMMQSIISNMSSKKNRIFKNNFLKKSKLKCFCEYNEVLLQNKG